MFAPAYAGRGRTLTWEGLANNVCGDSIRDVLPNTAYTTVIPCQGINQNFSVIYSVLMPGNLTRGVVTLERIRGSIQLFRELPTTSANFRYQTPIPMLIQLAPINEAAVPLASAILTQRLIAHVEDQRIIWKHEAYPHPFSNTGSENTARVPWFPHGYELDVKVRRRFNRARWALVFSATVETVLLDNELDMFYYHLRGLFRAPDAL